MTDVVNRIESFIRKIKSRMIMSRRNSFVSCNALSGLIKCKDHKPSQMYHCVNHKIHLMEGWESLHVWTLVLFLPMDCIEKPFTNIKLWEITNGDVTIFGSCIVDRDPAPRSQIAIQCHKTIRWPFTNCYYCKLKYVVFRNLPPMEVT